MRSILAFLLLLAGVLLVPVATAAWWANDTLVPADGFVETVAPLATDPVVVDEVEDRLTAETTVRIAQGTGVPGERVEPLVRVAVRRAVADPVFTRVWRTSTRDVHAQLTDVLSGSDPTVSDVGLRLAPLSDAVRGELVSSGVPFAERLPTVRATLPLLPAADLARAQGAFRLVEERGPDLPFVAALLLLLGTLVARRRAAAVGFASLAVLLELGLLGVGLLLVRFAGPEALAGRLPTPVARVMFDTLVAGLWRDMAVVAVAAFVVLIAAMVLGRATRR